MSADERAEVAEAGAARSLARAVSRVAWVARTELHTLLRSPVIYVIGALFLIVQGTSFSALIAAMSDPARPAPLGAVLEAQLGGTVLGWALLLMVLALLGMRVIAEPMRSGEWESLLSCGVSERAAVLGKYVASTLLLALLWLPTTSYLLVISRYQSGGGGWDGPSLVSGYLGVLALGAALLSLAFAASAVTSSSLVAAALGYLAGLVLLLAGEVATIAPELTQDSPRLAAISAALSLRLHAAALARGEVTAGALALWLSVTAVGLSAAVTLTTRGRRRKAEVSTRALATGLLALGGALALALAARGALAWDVSARRRNTLADATLAVLAEATAPVEIVIVEPTLGALRPLFSHAEPVLARMRRRQPLLSVSSLDPAALPGGLAAVAQQAGVAAQDLAGSGAIIVRVGARQRVIDFFEISELAESEAGPAVLRWSVERAVAGRLAELLRPAPVTVCHSEGHGELPLAVAAGEASASASASASAPPQLDLAALRARAHDDGVRFLPLPDGAVPSACHVVLVAAPGRPLPPAQALELAQFVERGGGLVVGLASRALDPAGQPLATGLEPPARRRGPWRAAGGGDGSRRGARGRGAARAARLRGA
ncbi:MAG: Gldg family protein [Myxococcales bacterium]|nr:Gldg family protein [Myxococcales bacterium]